jgi:type IV secretion system protein VirB4
VFVSQSLAEVVSSSLCDLLLESCPTKVLLPNPEARTPQTRALYRRIGLTERQIELIAEAVPKREYYVTSPLGRRLIDLGLGPAALAFLGAGSPDELAATRALEAECGDTWPHEWLRARGLEDWAEVWNQLKGELR